MRARAMTVAGIMSGTSADGIDVAVVRIEPHGQRPRLALLAHEGFPFAAPLRRAILAAMNSNSTSMAEIARLNWRLGLAYSDAVTATLERHKIELDLVGCHGQTLYHQSVAAPYTGRTFACTWQAGEAQAIASALRVPVVSNFRPADMLAGGQGAPLVPLLDYVIFADSKRGRVLQNIGGIANLTAIPAGAEPESLIAFDTGPGNMVIDALTQELFGKQYDRDGAFAARGRIIKPVLKAALRDSYYRRKPPRTAGREQFGREFAAALLKDCRKLSKKAEDAIATATALTAETIANSYAQFAHPAMRSRQVDFIVSGGGARNRTLMRMLNDRLEPLGCTIAKSDKFSLAAARTMRIWLKCSPRASARSAARSPAVPRTGCRSRRKKPRHSRFSPGRRGIIFPAMFLQRPERNAP
jgi:anhydro-N-acetylmuramic acid kinase